MPSGFGYRMLQGKGTLSGHIRLHEQGLFIQCRGWPPGAACRLYRDASLLQARAADAQGCVSFSAAGDGFFYLCDEKNTPLLWEETESCTQGYCHALHLLSKRTPPPAPSSSVPGKAAVLLPDVSQNAPPPAEEPSPQPQAENAPPAEKAAPRYRLHPGKYRLAPPKSPAPSPGPPFALRPAASTPPAFSLPVLAWPEGLVHIRSAISGGLPFSDLGHPGFRCRKLPCPHPAFPYCVVGYQTKESRLAALLYALPGHPMMPPRGFGDCVYQQGHWLRIQSLG